MYIFFRSSRCCCCLDELFEVVVDTGCGGGGDVVAVLILLELLWREGSPLANTEKEHQKVYSIGGDAHDTHGLDDKVEEVTEVAGHHARQEREEHLHGGDESTVDEGQQEHQGVEGNAIHRVGLVQGVLRPQQLFHLAKASGIF